ncbi:hypothetical protein V6N13_120010 [Hibiscus sabdariffa]|uniref:Uncharacterized protein n=2 Tax=Hibiscus sabdariffa TaxID=183260 RepID=A0ABR2A5R2_9ROSI
MQKVRRKKETVLELLWKRKIGHHFFQSSTKIAVCCIFDILSGIVPAVDLISNALVGNFYFIGFGLFCQESVVSIWVIQQVYMYFRGSGKAARGAMTYEAFHLMKSTDLAAVIAIQGDN